MSQSPQVASPDAESALTRAEVESFFSALGKAIRAFTMYQSNNPVFQRFQETLRSSIEELWTKATSLEVTVAEDGFRWDGEIFSVGKGRDNLAFSFYKDGVRYLTFLPGFEDEVGTFLAAVNRAQRGEEDSDDLITVLWEQDFAGLQYGYVDLLADGLQVPDEPQSEPGLLDLGSLQMDLTSEGEEGEEGEPEDGEAAQPEAEAGRTGPVAGGLTREDFEETLYFLDHAEMAALQTEVEVEMERDVRRDVLNALFDRLEEGARPVWRGEILDILDQLMPLFLSRGDMTSSALILEELDAIRNRNGSDAELRDRVDRLFERLSDPAVLEQFVQALEDGAVSPESDQVNLFFSRLHAGALPVLIRFAETSEIGSVKSRLASAIDGLATRYPAEVDTLLGSDEPALVAGAARVAGRVALAQAVPALQTTLRQHRDARVRMAIVEALVSIRTTQALTALIDAIGDEDRDVRIAAAKALGAVRFASARDRLAQAVAERRLRDADLTEKMAIFEAYGAVGGSAAVDRLEQMLTHKGLLGRRHPTEIRACAALGLAQSGTPEAKRVLERAKQDDDPVVRNAVLRALRQEGP